MGSVPWWEQRHQWGSDCVELRGMYIRDGNVNIGLADGTFSRVISGLSLLYQSGRNLRITLHSLTLIRTHSRH